MSVSHTRLLLEQFEDQRSGCYKQSFFNLLLDQRHWSTELMTQSLWWSLGNAINDTNNLKKSHSLGSPFFLGLSLAKLSSYGDILKLDINIHTMRTEYSFTLAEFIVKTVQCAQQYGALCQRSGEECSKQLKQEHTNPLGKKNEEHDEKKEIPSSDLKTPFIMTAIKIKDITAYFINSHQACLLLSFSEITLSKNQQMSNFKFEDFQIAIMRSLTSSSLCLTDFTDIFANCKLIRLDYEQQLEQNLRKITIYIPNNCDIMWNCNLHMHSLTLVRDINALAQQLGLLFLLFSSSVSESSSWINDNNSKNKGANNKNHSQWMVELSAERSTIFEIKLNNNRHTLQLFFENLFFSHKQGYFLSVENVFIKIDDQHIFTFKDLDVYSLEKLDMLTHARVNCEGFILPTNKVWLITIGSFKVSTNTCLDDISKL